ncbi:hypothetical protein [Chthonobacter albigriseus]|uniref:hypothetical protein n=1 Tax=Chthonobacter albigriseus TaxID=1683161 RepID=UPI001FCE5F5D|nr:hypothetical protein [Chthonobacter albigriseus]
MSFGHRLCLQTAAGSEDKDVAIDGNPFGQQQADHPVQVPQAGYVALDPICIPSGFTGVSWMSHPVCLNDGQASA